ncbi:hypothetical protein M0R19_04850 [Candidatus Pacearchaeota archaeon]|jgi:hypothetical protein|nr:hypothetical protein [Candidatus Pacearchaeota archaeon]
MVRLFKKIKSFFTTKKVFIYNERTLGKSTKAILECIEYCLKNKNKQCFYLTHNHEAAKHFYEVALQMFEVGKVRKLLWFFKIKETNYSFKDSKIQFPNNSKLIFMSTEDFYRKHCDKIILNPKVVKDHYAYEIEFNKSINPILDRKYQRYLKEQAREREQKMYDKKWYI